MPLEPEPEFNPSLSSSLRDEGMARVRASNPTFSDLYFMYIFNLPLGWIGTNEDIRAIWPYPQPTKPQAWSSCWGHSVRAGLLLQLPIQVHMTSTRSHRRRTHLFERVRPSALHDMHLKRLGRWTTSNCLRCKGTGSYILYDPVTRTRTRMDCIHAVPSEHRGHLASDGSPL